MPDEHAVADLDAVADEGVALDLAARTDDGAALDLDERADARPVPDPAAVQVRERVDDDLRAELDVVDQPVRRLVRGRVAHRTAVPDHRRHPLELVLPELGEERQRERRLGPLLGRREVSRRVAERCERRLQVQRHRVVHPARDPLGRERVPHAIAGLRPDHVQMPDGSRPLRDLRRDDDAVEQLRVRRSVTPPQLVPVVEPPELHAQHRGLERVEPFVAADRDVLVLAALPEVAEHANRRVELLVVRGHGAGVAVRAEILARIEAEGGDVGERAATPPAVLGSVRLRRILDEPQAVALADSADRIRIARVTEEIDADDRLRSRRDGGRREIDVQLAEAVAVDEHRRRAEPDDREDRGDERVRRSDHLVAPSDLERVEGERECGGARGDADGVLDAAVGGPLAFEAPDLLAEDVLRGGDRVDHRTVDLLLDRRVLPLQIDELDRLGHGREA